MGRVKNDAAGCGGGGVASSAEASADPSGVALRRWINSARDSPRKVQEQQEGPLIEPPRQQAIQRGQVLAGGLGVAAGAVAGDVIPAFRQQADAHFRQRPLDFVGHFVEQQPGNVAGAAANQTPGRRPRPRAVWARIPARHRRPAP